MGNGGNRAGVRNFSSPGGNVIGRATGAGIARLRNRAGGMRTLVNRVRNNNARRAARPNASVR